MTILDQEFLDSVNIFVISVFGDGTTIKWMSRSLLEKLGYTLKEIVGKSMEIVCEDLLDLEKPVRLKSKTGVIYLMKFNCVDSLYFFLETTEELVDKLVNLLNDGIIILKITDLDDPGKLVFEFVNKTADRIAGGNITGFVGKTLGESFPKFMETGFPQKYLDCYKSGVSTDLGEVEYGDEIVKKQVFKIECIPLVGGRVIVHYYSLTIKHQIKESLLKSVTQTQADIINKKSVHEIIRNILRDIIKLTESKMGYVAELRINAETGKEYLDCIGIVTDSWNEESGKIINDIAGGSSLPFTRCGVDETMFGVALQENKKGIPFICDDVHTDSRRGGKPVYPSGHPQLHAYMAMPLLFHGVCIGQLGIANADNGYDVNVVSDVDPLLIACANVMSSYALTKKEEDLQKQVGIEREKKKIAEEIAKAKDTFLANMSHELKTLLNGIVGMSQLLIDTEMSLTQTDYANTIHQCSVQLLAIINDILDFSKMEAGRVNINHEPFDLRECVEEAYDVVSLKAGKKGLNISYLLDQKVPTFIIGDKARIKQVLINLLENAIKFTEKGEVYTSIKCVKEPDNGTYTLKFSVHDTGIGIEADKKDMIFDIFTQAHADVTTKKYPGTGLGLPICRHLVELMDGELWVESVYGKGSVFQFTVRVEENHDADSTELDDPVLVGKKVLIVDDNATNRTILCSTVIKWKMKPIMCGSAEEALVFINSGYVFDLGLLDIQMPGVSGIMLAQEIKKINKNIPLIALSSMGNSCNVSTDLFVGTLNKPIKDARLYNMCVNVLKPNIKVRYNKDRTISNVSYKETRILLAEDVIFNQKVALGFLDKLGYKNIDVVKNGVEVMEKIKKNKYNVVFMDLIMEPVDGFQATREITRFIPERTDRPFIVAMTAQTTDTIKEKCYEVGMDGFIGKPIVLKELETMLDIIEKSIAIRNDVIVV